jgi:hypothetical protein
MYCYYSEIGSSLIKSPEIMKACIKTARGFYGKDNVEILEKPSIGGEDFVEYLNKISTISFYKKSNKYLTNISRFDQLIYRVKLILVKNINYMYQKIYVLRFQKSENLPSLPPPKKIKKIEYRKSF